MPRSSALPVHYVARNKCNCNVVLSDRAPGTRPCRRRAPRWPAEIACAEQQAMDYIAAPFRGFIKSLVLENLSRFITNIDVKHIGLTDSPVLRDLEVNTAALNVSRRVATRWCRCCHASPCFGMHRKPSPLKANCPLYQQGSLSCASAFPGSLSSPSPSMWSCAGSSAEWARGRDPPPSPHRRP